MAKFINNVTSADESINKRLNDLEARLERKRPEKLTCENCGAPISPGGKCPYCGTSYKLERNAYNPQEKFFRIEVERPGVHTLRAIAAIDRETYMNAPAEAVADCAIHQIKRQMMDELTAFIRFDREEDPFMDRTLIRGTIRVVDPSFRF